MTLLVIGRMEGWKDGSARFHPSILPSFQSVNLFSRKFETCWLLEVIRKEDANKTEFEAALRTAVQELEQLTAEESHQWIRAVYYLLLLIYHERSPDEHVELREVVAQSIRGTKRRKEMEEMKQTIAQKLIQEGVEIGEERGKLNAKREAVLRLLQLRFHPVPPSLPKKVRAIRRMERLNALFDQAAVAKAIDEIQFD